VEICTIGFTQTTAEHFFTRLADAKVERLLDVRLNNSSQLAGFAKAKGLPYFLRELVGATYEHQPLLAPTQEIHTTVAPSVTDVRLVEPDHSTVRRDAVTDVNARLRDGVDVYAMVGLSRAFPKRGNLHWVQINGLCLADSPLGDSP